MTAYSGADEMDGLLHMADGVPLPGRQGSPGLVEHGPAGERAPMGSSRILLAVLSASRPSQPRGCHEAR